MKNIIFIHGNSSSSKVINPVIKIWNDKPQIIGIDLPGHGRAERTGDYSWVKTKNYLINKINSIKGDKLLIGNSVGGNYAIEIAPKINSLKGLVLLSSPPLKKPLNFQEAYAPNPYTINYLKGSVGKKELEETLNAAAYNKSVIGILREDFLKTDPKVRTTMGSDLTNPDNFLDEAEIFSTLNCRKYIINGKQDLTVNPEYLKQIQEEAIYPFKLIEIDHCGHYPTLEKPEEFATILEKISDEVF